jgi:hypothetical protein
VTTRAALFRLCPCQPCPSRPSATTLRRQSLTQIVAPRRLPSLFTGESDHSSFRQKLFFVLPESGFTFFFQAQVSFRFTSRARFFVLLPPAAILQPVPVMRIHASISTVTFVVSIPVTAFRRSISPVTTCHPPLVAVCHVTIVRHQPSPSVVARRLSSSFVRRQSAVIRSSHSRHVNALSCAHACVRMRMCKGNAMQGKRNAREAPLEPSRKQCKGGKGGSVREPPHRT